MRSLIVYIKTRGQLNSFYLKEKVNAFSSVMVNIEIECDEKKTKN
jgi:hypothetical protein